MGGVFGSPVVANDPEQLQRAKQLLQQAQQAHVAKQSNAGLFGLLWQFCGMLLFILIALAAIYFYIRVWEPRQKERRQREHELALQEASFQRDKKLQEARLEAEKESEQRRVQAEKESEQVKQAAAREQEHKRLLAEKELQQEKATAERELQQEKIAAERECKMLDIGVREKEVNIAKMKLQMEMMKTFVEHCPSGTDSQSYIEVMRHAVLLSTAAANPEPVSLPMLLGGQRSLDLPGSELPSTLRQRRGESQVAVASDAAAEGHVKCEEISRTGVQAPACPIFAGRPFPDHASLSEGSS